MDERHSLTDSEHAAVVALKEACDKGGVRYDSLFQLAKYVLVVHSSVDDQKVKDPKQAADKRLCLALDRIKRRNAWAEKLGLQNIDAYQATLEIDKLYPQYHVYRYASDKVGRIAWAIETGYPPTNYVCTSKEQRAKYLAAEQLRLDLAAADLSEARRGICLVATSEGLTLQSALSYMRLMAAAAKDNLADMHPHRVRAIYAQVPAIVLHFVNPAKRLLPRRVADRITIFKTIDALDESLLPQQGPRTSKDWLDERLSKYRETVDKLTL